MLDIYRYIRWRFATIRESLDKDRDTYWIREFHRWKILCQYLPYSKEIQFVFVLFQYFQVCQQAIPPNIFYWRFGCKMCIRDRYWRVIIWKGAHTFFSELVRQLQVLKVQFSYDFVKAKSYEGTSSTGNGRTLWSCFQLVKIEGCNMESLKGRNVIIVEDIIDTGKTMSELIPYSVSYTHLIFIIVFTCIHDTFWSFSLRVRIYKETIK